MMTFLRKNTDDDYSNMTIDYYFSNRERKNIDDDYYNRNDYL